MASLWTMSAIDQAPDDAEYARLKAQSETIPDDPEISYRLGTAAVACGCQEDSVRAFAKAAKTQIRLGRTLFWPGDGPPCIGAGRCCDHRLSLGART